MKILLDIGGPIPLLITGILIIGVALVTLRLSARRRRHDKAVIAKCTS